MAGRIPMVGDPKPLDREAMGRELNASVAQMRADSERLLADAEAVGDEAQIREFRKMLAKLAKLS